MKSVAFIAFFFISFGDFCFAQQTVRYNTYLRSDAGTDTMWDGRIIRVFGIASRLSEMPHIPAKTLYCNEGDTLILHTLSISQGDHHTIHLHGMDATTPNDGDPATSFWLNHMQDTDYTVYAAHAGTYIYHCHVADVVHVQMGMYGLIVVKPRDGSNTAWTDGPAFDRSYNWLLSEVDPLWHDSIPHHDPITDTVHIPPYIPKYFLINGKSETQLPLSESTGIKAKPGESVYLRIGSIGFFYERIIFPHQLHARKIDSDGRPLDEAIESDTVELAPGERYGILLDAMSELSDIIEVEFLNMNTDSVWSMQTVPIIVSASSVMKTNQLIESLSVFPNPARITATFSIKGMENVLSNIAIVNVLGKIIYHGAAILPLQFDLSTFPTGVYDLTVLANGKHLHRIFDVIH